MQAPDVSRKASRVGHLLRPMALARTAALGLALGVLLSACGGGSGDSASNLGSDGKTREVRCAR